MCRIDASPPEMAFQGASIFETEAWNSSSFTILSSSTHDVYILLRAPLLKAVYMQHNPKVFQLFIEHCALTSVPKTIGNLLTLQKFSIRYCRLRYLNMNDFIHVRLLSMLDLAHNHITAIFEVPNRDVQLPIKQLFLTNNSLRHVNLSWFGAMKELTCLYLDDNHIEDLDTSIPMPGLQELSVSHNRLRMLDLSRWNYLPLLQSIYCNSNSLSSPPTGWNSLIRLEVLELSCNQIGSFRMDDLYLTQVRSLSLTANKLTNVTTSVLHLRVPLEVLRLSHNRLTVLDVSRWGMPNLSELNVANNRLTLLGDTFTRFPSLHNMLNLAQNRWSCRWLKSIHASDLHDRNYGMLSTNASCPDRRQIITEHLWICCSDGNDPV